MTSLAIAGHADRPIANTFFRRADETIHLAVLFPGLGYTAHMPVLYYPGQLLQALGADVLRVDSTYGEVPGFQALDGAARAAWLAEDATAVLATALAQRTYTRLTLVGKSIGTLAVGHLLTTRPPVPTLECVWLTPLLRFDALRLCIAGTPHRALFVIGTADPHYDAGLLDEVRHATGGEALVLDGADHSLEIPGDPSSSVRLLHRLVTALQHFLA